MLDTITSPFDGSTVGTIEKSDRAAALSAIATARRAFPAYRDLPRFVRADILERAAAIVAERREEFAQLIAREAGKPLYDARGEVSRSIFNLRNAAAEGRRFGGEEVPLDVDEAVAVYQTVPGDHANLDRDTSGHVHHIRKKIGLVRRLPSGPVLAITPFNFPLNLVLHKVAPALAVGATVVLKPAPQTPLTSVLLAEVLTEAGLPEGVLTVVHCDVDVADTMVRDERLHIVTFTGSAAVGWHIKNAAGRKKVLLELGGNGAVIVAEDGDVDRAVACSVRGGVVFAGQYCIGVQRILVHQSRYEEFVAKLRAAVAAVTVGDPLQDGVECGPVINAQSADRIEAWIGEAVAAGAVVETGGTREGNIIAPTVLSHTAVGMKVEDEEIFGPVVTVRPYEDFDDAIDQVNSSKYGLQGAVFTQDLRKAIRAGDRIDVGALIVNDSPTFRVDSMPFGGQKQSGLGREGTRWTMEELTDTRLLVMDYS
jgi:acyl-CoA reductase-like NAD-dependent aldehyde dehydrogenase